MRLGIKLLNQSAQLNDFQYIDQLKIQKGDTSRLTFQLWDLEKDQRYIPPAGATILTTTGTTQSGPSSNLLVLLASMAGVATGQAITGSTIPPGTTVLSVTGNTVLMSQGATGAASNITIGFQTYGTTVQVLISRFAEYFGNIVSNTRVTQDYSVSGYAAQLTPADDRSLWYLPLTATQTANITSSGVSFTMNDGTNVKQCTVPAAIQASNLQES